MRKIIETLDGILVRQRRPIYRPRALSRVPELPIGFVPRSDPNFYFLSRKF